MQLRSDDVRSARAASRRACMSAVEVDDLLAVRSFVLGLGRGPGRAKPDLLRKTHPTLLLRHHQRNSKSACRNQDSAAVDKSSLEPPQRERCLTTRDHACRAAMLILAPSMPKRIASPQDQDRALGAYGATLGCSCLTCRLNKRGGRDALATCSVRADRRSPGREKPPDSLTLSWRPAKIRETCVSLLTPDEWGDMDDERRISGRVAAVV